MSRRIDQEPYADMATQPILGELSVPRLDADEPKADVVRASDSALAPRTDPTLMEIISAVAQNPQADVAKMAALLDLKERMEARSAEQAYNEAFSAMAHEMPKIPKRGVKDMGQKGSIKYEKWEDLNDLIGPVLAKFGFSLSFPTRLIDGKLTMVLVIRHIAGHFTESFMEVRADPGPGRNDIQAMGSGRSYTKRYLAKDALNIITEGEDDDGRKAHAITQEQVDTINSLISEIGMTPKGRESFFRLAGVDQVEDIQSHRYADIVQALSDKRRVKAGQK